jgi:hypothetical protein
LTFVEYAMVPAERLRADAPGCAPRTASQALLTDWLKYLTGPGQTKLAKGFVALPDSLKTEATAALLKVGAAPTTGACAATAGGGDVTTATTVDTTASATPEPADADPLTPGADPLAAMFDSLFDALPAELLPAPVSLTNTSAPAPSATAPASNPVARAAAALIRPVGAILDPRRIGQFWPTLALLGVLALITFAVQLTARRDPWRLF